MLNDQQVLSLTISDLLIGEFNVYMTKKRLKYRFSSRFVVEILKSRKDSFCSSVTDSLVALYLLEWLFSQPLGTPLLNVRLMQCTN